MKVEINNGNHIGISIDIEQMANNIAYGGFLVRMYKENSSKHSIFLEEDGSTILEIYNTHYKSDIDNYIQFYNNFNIGKYNVISELIGELVMQYLGFPRYKDVLTNLNPYYRQALELVHYMHKNSTLNFTLFKNEFFKSLSYIYVNNEDSKIVNNYNDLLEKGELIC